MEAATHYEVRRPGKTYGQFAHRGTADHVAMNVALKHGFAVVEPVPAPEATKLCRPRVSVACAAPRGLDPLSYARPNRPASCALGGSGAVRVSR